MAPIRAGHLLKRWNTGATQIVVSNDVNPLQTKQQWLKPHALISERQEHSVCVPFSRNVPLDNAFQPEGRGRVFYNRALKQIERADDKSTQVSVCQRHSDH